MALQVYFVRHTHIRKTAIQMIVMIFVVLII